MVKALDAFSQRQSRTKQIKVLILKPSAMGDIVMALPAVRNIKLGLPGAKIYWLVNKGFAGLLKSNPNVDEVIEFDRQLLSKLWYNRQAWEEFKRLVAQLRQEKFDVVLDFQGLLRTGVIGWLSGCKVRIGMKDAREGSPFFYTDLVARPRNSMHVVDYYAEMAEMLWVEGGRPVFDFGHDEAAKQAAQKILGEEGIVGDYAVIVAGASDPAKRWPPKLYARLCEKLSQEYGLAIVATGTPDEAAVIDEIANQSIVKVHNLAGRTNIPELVEVLADARVVVGNDTGPTHIAAGLGVPLVVIFGMINPARLYPYGRKECVAAIDAWERPDGIRCDNLRYHVRNVTLEMVWDKVLEQMKVRYRSGQ